MQQNANTPVIFSMSSLDMVSGTGFKKMEPDKHGVYHGIPMMIVGKATDNGVMYETKSALAAINGSNSLFRIRLQRGGLEGETVHPSYIGLSDKEAHERAKRIDRTMVSHAFVNCYARKVGDVIVIFVDILPYGPYKDNAIEALESSVKNFCLSIRTFAKEFANINGISHRRILSLVTADQVELGGYLDMGKQMLDVQVSEENLSIDHKLRYGGDRDIASVSVEDFVNAESTHEIIAMEGLTNQELLDLFEVDKVRIGSRDIVHVTNDTIITQQGNKHSLFHTAFGGF